MSGPVQAAVVARLASAFPDWHDASGDPNRTQPENVPAYIGSVTYSGADRTAMDGDDFFRDGEITVSLVVDAQGLGDRPAAEAAMQGFSDQADAAILAAPSDLDGLLWELSPDQRDIDHDIGEVRTSRADLTYSIRRVFSQA